MQACALCRSDKPLKESHIIPKFVFERIKLNSPTGFLRGGFINPDLRKQDGDKPKMLCKVCEQSFSKVEKQFGEEIFEPYQKSGVTSFKYGPWLSYFICSVNWRTLHLDNIDFHIQNKCSKETISVLDDAESVLANFLLHKRTDIGDMENHILPMFEITGASPEIRDIEPYFLFRISAFDYTFFNLDVNGFYVCANLAGILLFTIIQKAKKDIWYNTLVNPNGGFINQPPVQISSPIIFNMLGLLIECSKVKVSQAQEEKIIESLKSNPEATQSKAWQIRKLGSKSGDNELH